MKDGLPGKPGDDARRLARSLRLSVTVAEWLRRGGHEDSEPTRRFLDPKLAHLSDPSLMADRAVAASRLAHAVRTKERVAVFGDYDCDGITATAIMTEALRALGGEAVPLLASRFDGGYGVSRAACERILATGAKLLVTCDCGSSDHASLAYLRERRVEVVVIDHHLVPSEPLPALAFLNPHRPECGFAYKGLASCGLALSLAAAVRTELGQKLDVRQWLDLVAIGTIADVAPLDGDNRALVRAGLGLLASSPRAGLRALAELSKYGAPLFPSARDVAFGIAPKLNAPGRLGAPDLALELLLARSEETARGIAATVEELSTRRRAIQETITAEAVEEIERDGLADAPAIVVGREGWNPGIVGIVAGKLVDRYGLPTVVVGFEGQVGRGSVRGPKGARLFDAVSLAKAPLDRFGGHQAAAGLEVRLERLAEFREAFVAAVRSLGDASAPDALADAVCLALEDDPLQVVSDIEQLEPWGQANPLPKVVVEGAVTLSRELRGGHLRLELVLDGGRRLGCFGANLGARAAELTGTVTILGELRRDTYRGGDAVELYVSRLLS